MWRRALLAAFLLAGTAQAADAPREKLNTTLATLKSTAENEKALRAKLEDSHRDIEKLRDDSTALAADLQASEQKVTREENRYATLSRQLDAKQADFDARKAEYAQTLTSLLRVQQVPATALLTSPENVHQLLRTAKAMQQVNGALAARAAQLRREVETLEALRGKTAASKTRLAQEAATLNEQQKRLNRDLSKRQALEKQLQRDHAAALARVQALSKESASLQELITKLEQDRAVVAEKTATPFKPITSTAQGRWKTPVAGSIAHRFGERKSANETYRGLVLSARSGGTVVAPAAGEVVFTGPFRDYGRMVLLKHGQGRISLLAGLGHIAVTLNQRVGAGEPLGTMGNGRPQLYYELRDGSKPIDPANWFANLGTNTARR